MALTLKGSNNPSELKVGASGNAFVTIVDVNGNPATLQATVSGPIEIDDTIPLNVILSNNEVQSIQSGEWIVKQGEAGAQAWPVNAIQTGNWSVTANAGTGIFNIQGEVISEPGTGVFKTRIEEGKGTSQEESLFVKNNKQFKTIYASANSGQALTITIPPVPGKLTYISKIQIDVYFNATFANIALSLGTITNLSPSVMSFFVPNSGNAGTTQSVIIEFPEPVVVDNSAANFVLSVPAIANKLYTAFVSYMND